MHDRLFHKACCHVQARGKTHAEDKEHAQNAPGHVPVPAVQNKASGQGYPSHCLQAQGACHPFFAGVSGNSGDACSAVFYSAKPPAGQDGSGLSSHEPWTYSAGIEDRWCILRGLAIRDGYGALFSKQPEVFWLFVAFCGYPQRRFPLERLASVGRETVSTASEN